MAELNSETTQAQIEAWIEDEIKYQSEGRLQYLYMSTLDDTFGWGKMLESYLNYPSFSIRKKHGLLLTGAYGCGKHTAAYHAVRFLTDENRWAKQQEEDAFAAVFLSGEDFSFPDAQRSQVYEYLNALLDAYEGKKLCLVLENPESCTQCDELLKQLGRFACMYTVQEDFAPLFIIVITEEERIVPPILRERLNLCRMNFPNRDRRLKFLENNAGDMTVLGSAAALPGSAISYEQIADETEGMTYAQLRDLLESASMYIDSEVSLKYEGLPGVVREQLPMEDHDTAKQRLFMKIEDLIDTLPELLEKHASSVQYVSAKESTESSSDRMKELDAILAETDKGIDYDKLSKEVDKMTGLELANQVFGKEDAAEILRLGELLRSGQS